MKSPLTLIINNSSITDKQSLTLKMYLFLFGTILVIFHQFIYPISTSIQWVIFVGTMLVTGIPHGAIDHLVDEQNALNENKAFSISSFLQMYLGKMIIYGLVWWFFPILAITIFMGISAFHFGETDLLILPKNEKAEKFLFLSYGWILLNILFLTHLNEVITILQSLPHFLDAFTNVLILVMGKYKIEYFGICGLLFLISFITYAKTKDSLLPILMILIQGIAILLICTFLPFLLAFAFYFGLWHSLLCFQSIRQYIVENQQIVEWKKLAKKATLFSLIAIFGILFFILIGNFYNQTSNLLFWLFIGIAILTAPHMSVMSTMFSAMKEK
jgi:beta-carotene 15,15'-dioxygenase